MQLFDRFNLGHGFRKYFEILPALDDTLRDDVFRIRHEVYCQELAFEPVRPDRRETDEFDRAIANFAKRYADQNEQDFETFTRAIGSGRLAATTGM